MPDIASAKDFFDDKVPAAVTANPDKAKEVNAIYLFKVSGDGGGVWTANLTANDGGPWVKAGEQGKAGCTIEISNNDFVAMAKSGNPQFGMQLYFQGKLKVSGDPTLAMKLQKFFAIT